MWKIVGNVLVIGLAVAVPVVRADHPVEKRLGEHKDHYEDAYTATKGMMATAGTKKIHDGTHKQGLNHEAHAVVKDGKIHEVTVKDVKTGKARKPTLVKTTKNPFKKSGKAGDQNAESNDDECGTQVTTLWYGWVYQNPYTSNYVFYWYPQQYVYFPPTYNFTTIYDYTPYITYYY